MKISFIFTSWLVQALLGCADTRHREPNIVFILTDDQDLQLDSLHYMPLLDKYVTQQGTFYGRHYCTTALCCPARASILTGKAAHNHNITDTAVPYGGYPKVVTEGINDNYLPVWLQEAGYNTYYTGKLWNAHSIENHKDPWAKGFNGSDFLLDPYTYEFYNPTFVRNHDDPIFHENHYSTDLINDKGLAFIDDAVKFERPFFLAMAPVAPHSDVHFTGENDANGIPEVMTSPPFPAKRHENLFNDLIVPRTPSFNPEEPSGVHWVKQLPLLNETHIEFNDYYYRQRIRSLQAVDELIQNVIKKLDSYNILDNTYVVFTTDNGFHVGQHRLQPGKYCPFEEDVHIPLIIRGPGVPRNKTTEIVTTHTDLTPTFFSMIGADLRDDFDGVPIPITETRIAEATSDRFEHIQVEYWGFALSESKYRYEGRRIPNNTYKATRVIAKDYNIYYAVWCTNEHELYDLNFSHQQCSTHTSANSLQADPYQINNIYPSSTAFNIHPSRPGPILGAPSTKLLNRLDALMMVLKTCKAEGCTKPWKLLHPDGNVKSLKQALHPKYDEFYEGLEKVEYDHCAEAYLQEIEGPTWEGVIGKGFIPG